MPVGHGFLLGAADTEPKFENFSFSEWVESIFLFLGPGGSEIVGGLFLLHSLVMLFLLKNLRPGTVVFHLASLALVEVLVLGMCSDWCSRTSDPWSIYLNLSFP